MIRKVIHFTDSKGFGGAEQVLLTILAELDRRNWELILVHYHSPGIMHLVEKARKLHVKTVAVPQINSKKDVLRMISLIRILQTECPAVFHAHLSWPMACTYGLISAVVARVPAVIATQQLYDKNRVLRFNFMEKLLSLGVNCYIAVSHEMARQLHENLLFSSGKIEVIHNGILFSQFRQSGNFTLRNSLARAPGQPIILTVARLDKQKGHSHLLRAAALVPEALFVLVGDGLERITLEAQARELGIGDRVIFLGQRDDIPDLMAVCDLFVLPSLNEGFPLVILEAMATGKPVIASAIGGIDEVIINGETGLLVPPADPSSLAKAIRKLLSDSIFAQRLATAGKAQVHREFSAETMVQRVAQIYDDLLS